MKNTCIQLTSWFGQNHTFQLVRIILSYFWHECFLRRFSSATLVHTSFSVSCSAIIECDWRTNESYGWLFRRIVRKDSRTRKAMQGESVWRIINWINSLSRTESTFESLSEPLAFRPIFYLFSYFTLMSLFYVAFRQCCGFDSLH